MSTTKVAEVAPLHTTEQTLSPFARRALAVLRLAFGFVFFWAFIDKLLGLGFATKPENAWVRGGNPTLGYLTNSPSGPFKGFYNSIAGAGWVNVLFMVGLLAIGVALLLGIGLRIAAVAGALLYVMMWTVALPPVTNPFLDTHLLGAISLVVLAATDAGLTWGLSKQWRSIDFVAKHPVLW